MRFHIKCSSYHHYACTMSTMLTMPIYNYRVACNLIFNDKPGNRSVLSNAANICSPGTCQFGEKCLS